MLRSIGNRSSEVVMLEYPKIQTVFLRDPATKYKTLLEGSFSRPEFEYLAHSEWLFTEKVDGTNIRVTWHDGKVVFQGKTNAAQIPPALLHNLVDMFPPELLARHFPIGSVCLYGEGYGKGINKGHLYRPDDVSFILFDVLVETTAESLWLQRADVCDIADKLGIDVVPIRDIGTLWDAVVFVKAGHLSVIGQQPIAEGLVMRPTVDLLDRRGNRIITKLKCKDFRG